MHLPAQHPTPYPFPLQLFKPATREEDVMASARLSLSRVPLHRHVTGNNPLPFSALLFLPPSHFFFYIIPPVPLPAAGSRDSIKRVAALSRAQLTRVERWRRQRRVPGGSGSSRLAWRVSVPRAPGAGKAGRGCRASLSEAERPSTRELPLRRRGHARA